MNCSVIPVSSSCFQYAYPTDLYPLWIELFAGVSYFSLFMFAVFVFVQHCRMSGVRPITSRKVFHLFTCLFCFFRGLWMLIRLATPDLCWWHTTRLLSDVCEYLAFLILFTAYSVIPLVWVELVTGRVWLFWTGIVVVNGLALGWYIAFYVIVFTDLCLAMKLTVLSRHVFPQALFSLYVLFFTPLAIIIWRRVSPMNRGAVLPFLACIGLLVSCNILRVALWFTPSDCMPSWVWRLFAYIVPEEVPTLGFLVLMTKATRRHKRSVKTGGAELRASLLSGTNSTLFSDMDDALALKKIRARPSFDPPNSLRQSLPEPDNGDDDSSDDEEARQRSLGTRSRSAKWKNLPYNCSNNVLGTLLELSVTFTVPRKRDACTAAVFFVDTGEGKKPVDVVLSRTEVMYNVASGVFSCMLLLPLWDKDAKLYFRFYSLSSGASKLVPSAVAGEGQCSAPQMLAQSSFTIDIQGGGAAVFAVEKRVECDRHIFQDISRRHRCLRSFAFPSEDCLDRKRRGSYDGMLYVHEYLDAGDFSYAVPHALVTAVLPAKTAALKSITVRVKEEQPAQGKKQRGSATASTTTTTTTTTTKTWDAYDETLALAAQDTNSQADHSNNVVELQLRTLAVAVYQDMQQSFSPAALPTDGHTFKSSVERAEMALCCVPVNLHCHVLSCTSKSSERASYFVLTVGAPAAHAYGFKKGGLHAYDKALRAAKHDLAVLSSPSATLRATVSATVTSRELVRRIQKLSVEMELRLDSCVCQAVASLVSVFMRDVELLGESKAEKAAAVTQQWRQLGYLLSWECLLSTAGNEMGMLEDMFYTLQLLQGLRVTFESVDNCTGPFAVRCLLPYSGDTDNDVPGHQWSDITVIVGVPKAVYMGLPSDLRGSDGVAVVVALFTQGINEKQSLANAVGNSAALQEEMNRAGWAVLYRYYHQFRDYFPAQNHKQISTWMTALEPMIVSPKREKNVELLVLCEDLTRGMNGGRITSCKSAKDRTSMAVTAEFVRLLQRHHRLPAAEVGPTLDILRTQGVRRENARRNIGRGRYAFNHLQRQMMPRLYQAPVNTFGAFRS